MKKAIERLSDWIEKSKAYDPVHEPSGVHRPLPTRETAGWHGESQSHAGVALRSGKPHTAKQIHRQVLSQLRSMKKPALKAAILWLEKARVDEGLSPQRKASQRAKRNVRTYSFSTPKSSIKRYHEFEGKKTPGALAGRPGEKIRGFPSKRTLGVHPGGKKTDRELRGRSVAGIMSESPVPHARKEAVQRHVKKLEELRGMKKPALKAAILWLEKAKEYPQKLASKNIEHLTKKYKKNPKKYPGGLAQVKAIGISMARSGKKEPR